ncbi:MAG: hypothetical protein IPM92_09765 [Saprospiraceae bacterium]|nr:hypothetical protein [Saprospiraceae bacterium]
MPDIDYCFSRRIYMDDGASILIKPSVVLPSWLGPNTEYNHPISACGKMWKEIVVTTESELFIRKAEIKNWYFMEPD